jgi:hypothetical protein
MSRIPSILFSVHEDIFEDLSKVASELGLTVAEVTASLVEHVVAEMGTYLISEGVRVDWCFGGEDLDDVEPDPGDPNEWREED